MDALNDPDVDLVGVYGMPGVGKSTLLVKIAEQLKPAGMFDVVVLALLSPNSTPREIQGKIADGLHFKLDAATDTRRANRLRKRLEKEKKILIILDDTWEELKLQDVGIPWEGLQGMQNIDDIKKPESFIPSDGWERDFQAFSLT